MKENKYDDSGFFEKYSQMPRSVEGLQGAGEWHELKKLLPDFEGKRVLDLGCGFGWHCLYAVEHGAVAVTGIDISEKMLEVARSKTNSSLVRYLQLPIEDIDFPGNSFDVVLSSLAFHYIESFEDICRKVHHCLAQGGAFVFSVENPIFTAQGTQDWHYDGDGNRQHWPVDCYFSEGLRKSVFLGTEVTKYHKTLTTYLNTLIQTGFEIVAFVEPQPDPSLLDVVPGMRDELRRPMMLLVSARKN